MRSSSQNSIPNFDEMKFDNQVVDKLLSLSGFEGGISSEIVQHDYYTDNEVEPANWAKRVEENKDLMITKSQIPQGITQSMIEDDNEANRQNANTPPKIVSNEAIDEILKKSPSDLADIFSNNLLKTAFALKKAHQDTEKTALIEREIKEVDDRYKELLGDPVGNTKQTKQMEIEVLIKNLTTKVNTNKIYTEVQPASDQDKERLYHTLRGAVDYYVRLDTKQAKKFLEEVNEPENKNTIRVTSSLKKGFDHGHSYVFHKEGNKYYLITSLTEADANVNSRWYKTLEKEIKKSGGTLTVITKNCQNYSGSCPLVTNYTATLLKNGCKIEELETNMPMDLEQKLLTESYKALRTHYEDDDLVNFKKNTNGSSLAPDWITKDNPQIADFTEESKEAIEAIKEVLLPYLAKYKKRDSGSDLHRGGSLGINYSDRVNQPNSQMTQDQWKNIITNHIISLNKTNMKDGDKETNLTEIQLSGFSIGRINISNHCSELNEAMKNVSQSNLQESQVKKEMHNIGVGILKETAQIFEAKQIKVDNRTITITKQDVIDFVNVMKKQIEIHPGCGTLQGPSGAHAGFTAWKEEIKTSLTDSGKTEPEAKECIAKYAEISAQIQRIAATKDLKTNIQNGDTDMRSYRAIQLLDPDKQINAESLETKSIPIF